MGEGVGDERRHDVPLMGMLSGIALVVTTSSEATTYGVVVCPSDETCVDQQEMRAKRTEQNV